MNVDELLPNGAQRAGNLCVRGYSFVTNNVIDYPSAALWRGEPNIARRTATPSLGLQRILARQPQVIRRAIELRAVFGDPVLGLSQLLDGLPVTDEEWDRIAQEPYG